jgi:hypothetical protein
MSRGRQHEYEDSEGRSPDKKDADAAHQGGSGTDEVEDGAAFLPRQWRSRGKGAHRRPAGGELAGVSLEVRQEKGTSAVLVKVKAAPEVDWSGSAT